MNTLHVHPSISAEFLKAGDFIVAPEGQSQLLAGIEFHVDKYVPAMLRRQVRKPWSKKRRIQNKWAANPRNWEDVNVAFLVDDSKPFLRPQPVRLDIFHKLPYWRTDDTNYAGLERAQNVNPFFVECNPINTIYGITGV